MADVVHVASGVLVNANGTHVLMGLRKPNGRRPHLWELPGGKQEIGETGRQAVIREWREEIGIDVTAGDQIGQVECLRVEVKILISLYEVREVTPLWSLGLSPPTPLDHARLGWVHPETAVLGLPCSPGYYLHYSDLMAWLRTR
jgi:8-oxo-dGTP diphosphatase